MKSKFFTLFAAFVLLFSAQASAQANGDVNGDGKVDEQDIAAILEIMAEAGGVKEKTKYYWYVGWTKPTSLETLKTLATGTHNGMSLGGETSKISGEKLLTNSPEIGPMLPPEKYYVVIPSGYNIYDATLPNVPITNTSFTKVTDVIINNHNIYISNWVEPTLSGLEIY